MLGPRSGPIRRPLRGLATRMGRLWSGLLIDWPYHIHVCKGVNSGCYETALTASDPEKGNGELSIEFPEEIKALINVPDPPTLSINVEYTLEKPRGGIQFIPGVSAHCFTMGESRLWFPCVDTNTELCTWTLEITVDTKLTVVACGELVDTVLHSGTGF